MSIKNKYWLDGLIVDIAFNKAVIVTLIGRLGFNWTVVLLQYL